MSSRIFAAFCRSMPTGIHCSSMIIGPGYASSYRGAAHVGLYHRYPHVVEVMPNLRLSDDCLLLDSALFDDIAYDFGSYDALIVVGEDEAVCVLQEVVKRVEELLR